MGETKWGYCSVRKFRTGANDLVMLVIFTCLVLRYRILYRNITSPSAQLLMLRYSSLHCDITLLQLSYFCKIKVCVVLKVSLHGFHLISIIS